MQTVSIIGFFIVFLLLVLISAVSPRRSKLSSFELERRKNTGNKSAALELERELVLGSIARLQTIIEALLIVFLAFLAGAAYGVWGGIFSTIAAVLLFMPLARLEVAQNFAEKLYAPYDESLVVFLRTHPTFTKLLAGSSDMTTDSLPSSREELEHVIDSSHGILSHDEKKLLMANLHFPEKTVESVMTPRGVVDVIAKNELIGPLALDELHKTGHSRFPVIDGDIDHVVGVLHIRGLLTLGDKASQFASDAMEKRVYYIHQEQTLDHALAAFLKTRHHLFVVVNGYRETAGILTLEDVMEAMLGRKIIDEFDLHDDLRAVAARAQTHNNNSSHGIDL